MLRSAAFYHPPVSPPGLIYHHIYSFSILFRLVSALVTSHHKSDDDHGVLRHIPDLVAGPVVADSLYQCGQNQRASWRFWDSFEHLSNSQSCVRRTGKPFLCWTCVIWFVLLVPCHFCEALYGFLKEHPANTVISTG